MSLKTRKSSAHLIISSAQLGVSEDIVKVMAKAAEYYGAKVYHLGATITEQEFKSLDKNVKGLASVTLEIGSVDHGDDEASSARAEKRLERPKQTPPNDSRLTRVTRHFPCHPADHRSTMECAQSPYRSRWCLATDCPDTRNLRRYLFPGKCQ